MSETTNEEIEKARQDAQNANDEWKEELDRVDNLGEDSANSFAGNSANSANENSQNLTGETDWKVEYTTTVQAATDVLDETTFEALDRRIRELGGRPILF